MNLTHHDIAGLSLKLAGIFALIQSFPMLQGVTTLAATYEYLADSGDSVAPFVVASLIPFLLLFFGGIALIRFGDRLAPRILGQPQDPSPTLQMSRADVQAVAFSVAGIALLVLTVPDLLQIIAQFISIRGAEYSDASQRLWRSTWITIIAQGFQFLLGLYLFFGGRALARFWTWAQETRPMKKAGGAD